MELIQCSIFVSRTTTVGIPRYDAAHNYHAGRIITNNQCGGKSSITHAFLPPNQPVLKVKAYEIEGRENAWVAAYLPQPVIPLFDSQQVSQSVLSSNPSLPLYAQAQKNPLTGDCPNSDVPAALTVMVSGFNSALIIPHFLYYQMSSQP